MERCYDCDKVITFETGMYETKNGEYICLDCYTDLIDRDYNRYKYKNLWKEITWLWKKEKNLSLVMEKN